LLEETGYTRALFINSSIAFALAVLVMFTIHEFGHALAALLLGLHPIVRPFSGSPGSSNNVDNVVTELAGPLVSLVTGAFILMLPSPAGGFWRLFWLWLGLLSVQEFAGYLIIGPFGRFGDIGDALHRLNEPLWVSVVVFLVGSVGTALLGRVATLRFVRLVDPPLDITLQVRSIGLFGWFGGAVLALIISVGSFGYNAGALFDIMGIVGSGIFLIFVPYYLTAAKTNGERQQLQFPLSGIVALLVLATLRQIILGPGLRL
jgi:hypothetical protein